MRSAQAWASAITLAPAAAAKGEGGVAGAATACARRPVAAAAALLVLAVLPVRAAACSTEMRRLSSCDVRCMATQQCVYV